MSSLTMNPTTTARRAQIMAEAVVSAYINEISPTERRRERARPHHSPPQPSPMTISRTRLAAHARRRALAPRRRTALELPVARVR
jgi:hypothetical protein